MNEAETRAELIDPMLKACGCFFKLNCKVIVVRNNKNKPTG